MDAERFEFEPSPGRKFTGVVHPFDKAFPVAMQLTALLAGPLMTAINAAKEDVIALHSAGHELDGATILHALGKVDVETLGKPLSDALNTLAARPALLNDLLAYSYFEGESLGKPETRNKAFTGHFGDLPKVVWEIVRANGWLPF